MIFISHFLEDVLAVSDRVTVLKNSRKVDTLENRGSDQARAGQSHDRPGCTDLAETYEAGTQLPAPVEGKIALELNAVTVPGEFENVTFDVHEGEILGLFGYLGAGMTEIARALFGRLKPERFAF